MIQQSLMNLIRASVLAGIAAIPGMCCNFSVSVPAIGAGGGVVAVGVNTQPGCRWNVTHTQSWLSAYGAQSGAGPGYVYLYAAPYSGRQRTQPIHVTVSDPGTCNTIPGRTGCPGGVAVVASTTAVQY